MTQLKQYEPKTIATPTKAEKEDAHKTHQHILTIIKGVKEAEDELQHSYVDLGQSMYKMQVKTYWISLGYASWKAYMEFLSDKYGTGRTQLYGYIGTVKTLSPYVDDQTLTDMGISKAKELKRAVDTTSKAPSEELLAKARDPKVLVPEFKKAINEEFHIVDHNEKGNWYDLKGCFFTPEEKEEWEKAIDLAKSIDPVVDYMLPESTQLKEALLRLAQEFIGTYGTGEEPLTENDFSQEKVDLFNELHKQTNTDSFESFEV